MTELFRSVILDEVGSTNSEAFAHAQAGETGPLWIVARRQTQGRGRSGRQWSSEPGNLYSSLLQQIACPQSVVHQLSLLAGVAVIDAIRAAVGPRPVEGLRLKWPNDILVGTAKCAGILPESIVSTDRRSMTTVIGIGINLAWHPEGLGRPVTHLAAHGAAITPDAMLHALAPSMQRWIDAWQCGAGFAKVRAAWLERAGPVGEAMTVDTGRGKVEGTFLNLDVDGSLVLRDAHGLQHKFTYGDVTLARNGAGGGR